MKRSKINPVSKKRQDLNKIRSKFREEILMNRMMCEARISGCSRIPTDVHEIKTRARGGSIIDADNVLALCRPCHRFITDNPAFAAEHGFVVHSWSQEPDMIAAALARATFVYGDSVAWEVGPDD
jgi:hypothetical protein